MSANLRQLRLAHRFFTRLQQWEINISEEKAVKLWIKLYARRFYENQKKRQAV